MVEDITRQVLKPRSKDAGKIDMRDLGETNTVGQNDHLMKRTPATKGGLLALLFKVESSHRFLTRQFNQAWQGHLHFSPTTLIYFRLMPRSLPIITKRTQWALKLVYAMCQQC
ncbi:hypothetical protein O9929_13925 [Vibrio lentus]|nr:hypothetical protein [Vibrio lentus]